MMVCPNGFVSNCQLDSQDSPVTVVMTLIEDSLHYVFLYNYITLCGPVEVLRPAGPFQYFIQSFILVSQFIYVSVEILKNLIK